MSRVATASTDRALALLDPLLARPALAAEGDDPPGRARQVGDDEANAQNKLARMPFDFGDHSARFGPTSYLIGEIGTEPANLVRGLPDWAPEQILDLLVRTASGVPPIALIFASRRDGCGEAKRFDRDSISLRDGRKPGGVPDEPNGAAAHATNRAACYANVDVNAVGNRAFRTDDHHWRTEAINLAHEWY
jgi:hypothetical protein